jgi:regulator of protease activity HflC (stomatin/prohibitin superfamily)
MKKLFLVTLSLLAVIALSSCGTMVPAGYVGVRVNLLGSNKGVDHDVVPVGLYYLGINQMLYLYPTSVQIYRFTQSAASGESPEDEAFYFQNKDGVKCNFDLGIQVHTDPDKVSILFQKYREDLTNIMKKNLRIFIQNKVQQYGSAMSVDELYGTNKITMIRQIEVALSNETKDYGLIIDGVSLLSDIRFPDEVEKAITAKYEAVQLAMQRENEVAKAQADAQIAVVQAQAQAKVQALQVETLTPLYVEYLKVKVLQDHWDGKFPQYVGLGSSLLNLDIGHSEDSK